MRVLALLCVVVPSLHAFRNPKVQYDPGLSSFLLDMSNAAYCEASALNQWGCLSCLPYNVSIDDHGLPDVAVIEGKVGGFGKVTDWGTQAVVTAMPIGEHGGQPTNSTVGIMVSFRGSANLINWIKDFEYNRLVPNNEIYKLCPTCKVHNGFYKSWVSVAEKVVKAVRKLRQRHPKADLYVTGHSLGAAMASLAATHLYYGEDLPVRYVYTFGEPRVGNKDYHHFFNKPNNGTAFRVTHWRDPVVRGPPKGILFGGYEHTATEVFYNENSTFHRVCDGSGEDPKCADMFSLATCLPHFSDHTRYLGRFNGHCGD